VHEEGVDEDKRCHGFDDGDGADGDAGAEVEERLPAFLVLRGANGNISRSQDYTARDSKIGSVDAVRTATAFETRLAQIQGVSLASPNF
jgi:hypothetical protein